MAINIQFVKDRWPLIVGGLVGLFILYYLLKKFSHSGGSSSPDLSAQTSGNVLALSSAASLQNAQLNAQISQAQLQAGVATNQIAAQLQASLADTAGKVAVASKQIDSQTAIALGDQSSKVAIQQLISDQAVAQTQIVANTQVSHDQAVLDYGLGVAKLQAGVATQQLNNEKNFQDNLAFIAKYSNRKANNVATIISALEGQGPQAIANNKSGFSFGIPGLFSVGATT